MSEGPAPDLRPEAVAALGGLDRLLEHRVRLAICALLGRGGRVTFTRFKQLLDETDGNLGANLQRLEEAGYVRATRQFADRRPVTWYALTAQGTRALERHLEALDAFLRSVAS